MSFRILDVVDSDHICTHDAHLVKTFPKTTQFDSYRFADDSKMKDVKKGKLTLQRRRMSCNTCSGCHKGEFELCQHATLERP